MAEPVFQLDPQKVAELSLVDLGHLILKTTNKPFHFRDLMAEVARLKGLTEEQVKEVIARLYTEINIDGRFVCIGNNVWGMKRWYPTDKTATEKGTAGKKFVRKDMDEDDFYDDDDDTFEEEVEDDEPFADYDEDLGATATIDETDEEDEEPLLDEEELEEAETDEEEELDTYEEDEDEF